MSFFEIEKEKRKDFGYLFEKCEDSCIITALAGWAGMLWADKKDASLCKCALIGVGDYYFLAGDADAEAAREMIEFIGKYHKAEKFNIRCVNKDFEALVEVVYAGSFEKYSRFATDNSEVGKNEEQLDEYISSLPKEYSLKLIDEKIYSELKQSSWGKEFTAAFDTVEGWKKKGLGVVILDKGLPIAGASSYSAYPGGIEVEIMTREEYQNKGLATIAGAALIKECKKRNLKASWDAAHEQSLHLADKFGFKLLTKYDCYCVSR